MRVRTLVSLATTLSTLALGAAGAQQPAKKTPPASPKAAVADTMQHAAKSQKTAAATHKRSHRARHSSAKRAHADSAAQKPAGN